MKNLLLTVAVFAVLLAPFFLFLAVLRFVPQDKRQGVLGAKRLAGLLPPPVLAFLERLPPFF